MRVAGGGPQGGWHGSAGECSSVVRLRADCVEKVENAAKAKFLQKLAGD
jgi:hypothetical protein